MKATQQNLRRLICQMGIHGKTNHISSAFYLWDLSPTSLLLGRDGCLEAVNAAEAQRQFLIHKQPHSTEVRSGPLASQEPQPDSWFPHCELYNLSQVHWPQFPHLYNKDSRAHSMGLL